MEQLGLKWEILCVGQQSIASLALTLLYRMMEIHLLLEFSEAIQSVQMSEQLQFILGMVAIGLR